MIRIFLDFPPPIFERVFSAKSGTNKLVDIENGVI